MPHMDLASALIAPGSWIKESVIFMMVLQAMYREFTGNARFPDAM